jgi:hypothetical protein
MTKINKVPGQCVNTSRARHPTTHVKEGSRTPMPEIDPTAHGQVNDRQLFIQSPADAKIALIGWQEIDGRRVIVTYYRSRGKLCGFIDYRE